MVYCIAVESSDGVEWLSGKMLKVDDSSVYFHTKLGKKVQTGWDGAAIEHNVKTDGIFMQIPHKAWQKFIYTNSLLVKKLLSLND